MRATGLKCLHLLFLLTLDDLNQPPNPDIIAIINYLQRLDAATLTLFLNDPSTFTPASASLDDVADDHTVQAPSRRRRGTGRHGPGATRRLGFLLRNAENNCFFNAALALGLAAWDAQQLPPSPAVTPAAATFFNAVQLLRDCMFNGSALPDHVIVSLPFSYPSHIFGNVFGFLLEPFSQYHLPPPPFPFYLPSFLAFILRSHALYSLLLVRRDNMSWHQRLYPAPVPPWGIPRACSTPSDVRIHRTDPYFGLGTSTFNMPWFFVLERSSASIGDSPTTVEYMTTAYSRSPRINRRG